MLTHQSAWSRRTKPELTAPCEMRIARLCKGRVSWVSQLCKVGPRHGPQTRTRAFSVQNDAKVVLQNYSSVPPPRASSLPYWTSSLLPTPLDVDKQIFCNRPLNLKQIKAVGFDMDYTLAQYKPETFEGLAYSETVKKLINDFHYPPIIAMYEFDWTYMMKGLIIDKKRGNTLKVDRHKYVKIAHHGFRALSGSERDAEYQGSSERESFDDHEYAMVDTLFSLAEAYLYMQLVELKDKKTEPLLNSKSYMELYKDLRAAVDLCHRDGSLKKEVARNPDKYLYMDDNLLNMLTMLRSSGRKVFLATNSQWDFTHVVMNYLLSRKTGLDKTDDWLSYFDVVMTGCQKPNFFMQKSLLFEVEVSSGMLINTDNGAPTTPIDSDTVSIKVASSRDGKGKVYQGGWFRDVHNLLNISASSEVLYVGDHIYADIVRSKKSLGWRTMLVVPELARELQLLQRTQGVWKELQQLRSLRDQLDDQIQRIEWGLAAGGLSAHDQDYQKNLDYIAGLKAQRDELKHRHSDLLAHHHQEFHPVWGQIMKTGYQNSRFAHQLERFACIYTSHVSNLVCHSPNKSFVATYDTLPHEATLQRLELDGQADEGQN